MIEKCPVCGYGRHGMSPDFSDDHFDCVGEMERQRDEARADADSARHDRAEMAERVTEMAWERDQARAEWDELQHRYDRLIANY